MLAWIQAPVTGKLEQIPGIGPQHKKDLMKDTHDGPICTSWQLFGKFLACKHTVKESSVASNEFFFHWLGSKGVIQNRQTIVAAIAYKMETLFPGSMLDLSAYTGVKATKK